MIVELYGLPGSGKSTFAKELSSRGGAIKISVSSRSELLVLNAYFFFLHPASFLGQLVYLLRFGTGPLWYMKFMNLFLVHNAKYVKAQNTRGVAIVDQGHTQNIISLFERPVRRETIKRYLRFLPRPDLLIVFDMPRSLREVQLEKRGYGVRDRVPTELREAWIRAAEKNHKTFLSLSPRSIFPVRVIRSRSDAKRLIEEFSGKARFAAE